MTTPAGPIVGMKNWNKKKKRWDGVVCQIVKDDAGKEGILVLDVMSAEHEIDLSEKIAESIATKPWLTN